MHRLQLIVLLLLLRLLMLLLLSLLLLWQLWFNKLTNERRLFLVFVGEERGGLHVDLQLIKFRILIII